MNKNKLKKGERLIGAYILKDEHDFYRISQISRVISFRVNKYTAVGRYVSEALESGPTGLKWLEMFIIEKLQCLSVIPDEQYLMDSLKSSNECVGRHPEWYGISPDELTKEQDDNMINEVKKDYMAEHLTNPGQKQGK